MSTEDRLKGWRAHCAKPWGARGLTGTYRLGPGPVRCCLAGPGPQASVLVPGQTGCTSVVPEFWSSVPPQPGTHLSGQLSGPPSRPSTCLGLCQADRVFGEPHAPLQRSSAFPSVTWSCTALAGQGFPPDCIPGGPTGVGEPSGGRLGRHRGWGSHLLPRGRPIWTLRLVWPRCGVPGGRLPLPRSWAGLAGLQRR